RPVRVNEWFGQIPEDTEQPPTSKATVERHDDAITIDLGRAPRRRKLSGFTVIGVIFTVFGALIMALSTELDSPGFPGKIFFGSLAVTLLGLAVLAVMWMKGRTRTVVDIAPDGIVFTYLGMLHVRQESFAHDDIVSIEAIAEGERNLSCLAVQLRSGR